MRVLFCHGLESGPHGRKYHAMVAAGISVEAPDFRNEDLATRVDHLLRVLADIDDPPLIVGSSFGGITAVLAAMQSGPVHGLVLCAPALALADRELLATAPTVIIHGARDEVCPIEHSRRLAEQPDVRLIEVDDDHGLGASLDTIVAEVRRGACLD